MQSALQKGARRDQLWVLDVKFSREAREAGVQLATLADGKTWRARWDSNPRFWAPKAHVLVLARLRALETAAGIQPYYSLGTGNWKCHFSFGIHANRVAS